MTHFETEQIHQHDDERKNSPGIDIILFDADSTLVTIEGIDELAKHKHVENGVVHLTHAAMEGKIPFERVYFERLDLIRPTYNDLVDIGFLYINNLTPGTEDVMRTLHRSGREIYIISGGFNPSIQMLGYALGIPEENIFANNFLFDETGNYLGVDTTINPTEGKFALWTDDGKAQVINYIQQLNPGKSTAMVGDGMGDWKAGQKTNKNIHFAGNATRTSIQKMADTIVYEQDLRAVLPYVL